jgi:putative mRNA 3-end processing factor
MNRTPPPLIELTPAGLYCPVGGFHIDPWRPVDYAVVTHAHSDHARPGSACYLTSTEGEAVLSMRLGPETRIESMAYGVARDVSGVQLSLYPAGHILGSSQVRLEYRGRVTVVSGDFKLDPDPTCSRFEPICCDTFVTESTFGLPIYRWPDADHVTGEIESWWRQNQEEGRASVLYVYALGKAQRVLASLDDSIGPIYTHGAVEQVCAVYREQGVRLPDTAVVVDAPRGTDWSRGLILAPPSARATPWLRRFGRFSSAMASGWMRIRGVRRRRSIDRGFVLSDHADWPGLLRAIRDTGAPCVWPMHGCASALAGHLREHGLDATAIDTPPRGGPRDDEHDPDAEAQP